MKANELMIGDWVLCEGTPLKVNVGQLHNLVCDTEWAERYPCEPMPLTDEILKANGWISTDGYSFQCDWITLITDKIALGFSIHINGRGLMLKYIHELQHALRLCGLTDLADNLKIS